MKMRFDTSRFTRQFDWKMELADFVESFYNYGLPFLGGALAIYYLNFFWVIAFVIPLLFPLRVEVKQDLGIVFKED